MLTLKEAQEQHRCRICEDSIVFDTTGSPSGWTHEFDELIFPLHVILRYGEEFAHAKCLGINTK